MSKRAKRAKIKYRATTSTISEYVCPHCHVNVIGAGIKMNITRFLCTECDNEIIVEHNIKK